MNNSKKYISILFPLILISCVSSTRKDSEKVLVHNAIELRNAVEGAGPGTNIVLSNGVWSNVDLLFEGKGTAESPIKFIAETEGSVTIEGESSVRIAGEHLEISGLIFRNGHSTHKELISFKKDADNLANHCRVTRCYIDRFNKTHRFERDVWVAMYGKNNRFDHNMLVGKQNQGVVLAVRLNQEESLDNHHQIDHNYFGYRQVLGSNGGEIIRVGTSSYALSYSNTKVEYNYFEHCNGEVEIVSNKSCGNEYSRNVFYECKGTLTLRHGNDNLVANNYFIGNHVEDCGGIRVINEQQTVRGNYLYGLDGSRFRGALVMMNGVPGSPLNRYAQVKDSKIEHNLILDCSNIGLSTGSDSERTATPENTTFSNNIIYAPDSSIFKIYDDISGITFRQNIINKTLPEPLHEGVETRAFKLKLNKEGLYVPDIPNLRYDTVALPVTQQELLLYPIHKKARGKEPSARIIKVQHGKGSLATALQVSNPYDTIELAGGETYELTRPCEILHPVTLMSAGNKAVIRSTASCFFKIGNGATLNLIGLVLEGKPGKNNTVRSIVSTDSLSTATNYKLFVKDCIVKDFEGSLPFNFIKIAKHTFADTLHFENCKMYNIKGNILPLNRETEDKGIYNAENIMVKNCEFSAIAGCILDVYRGGTDESTLGPMVKISGSSFNHCGEAREGEMSIKLHGAQKVAIHRCGFSHCTPVQINVTNGDPLIDITDCKFVQTREIVSNAKEKLRMINVTYTR